MDAARYGEFEKIALEVRKDVVRMLGVARAGGFKRAVGIVDFLVYMYWGYMKIFPGERNRKDRDRFVLGKGAATPALYACLARLGFFSRDELWNYGRLGAMLQGYPDTRTPGIDAPWSPDGSIGIACGLAMSLGHNGAARVLCLVDGNEMLAGASLVSSISAASEETGNLVLVVDSGVSNGHAANGPDVFGWDVSRADGNDYKSLDEVFGGLDYASKRPKAVVLSTGTGDMSNLGFQEGDVPMSKDDVDDVISLLENDRKDVGSRQ
jgi:transketolase